MLTPLTTLTTIGRTLRERVNAGTVAASEDGQAFTPITDVYTLRRAYVYSSQYNHLRTNTADGMNALPRTIRGVLPLALPAVSWWSGNLYRGAWTSDGRRSSSGRDNMIPWEDDAPDELVLAAQTAFTWGNLAQKLRQYAWTGAICGDVFGEIEIDYEREKSYPRFYDPERVTNLVLNGSGDVIAYRLTVPRYDVSRKQPFEWSKLVTKDSITTYYNDNEQGFSTVTLRNGDTGIVADSSVPAEMENGFGFAPGAWVNHLHLGAAHGACAIDGLFALIDELNGVQSEVNDYIMRFAKQKIIVSSNDPKKLSDMLAAATAQMATSRMQDPQTLRDSIPILPAPEGVSVHPVLENPGLGESAVHFDRMMKLAETNLPEAFVEERLSNAGDVTGPGARAIVAPVQRKLDASTPGYDHGLVKLGQMNISIQAELQRLGIFGRNGLTDQMKAFSPYRLDSFDKGDLTPLAIASRDLVPLSRLERAQAAQAIEALQTPWGMRMAGLSDAEIYGADANGKALEPETPERGILGVKAANRQASMAASLDFFNGGGGVA